ncbi:MAG: ribosomal RNA small subunit methyltransferase A [Myxococcales bacterium]|nr:ribosomal RNA small subunit methyltransferase A [Myxococcales bacterium]
MSIAPKKSLGQHFLHDQGVLSRIAALARPEPGSGLVEIGPGTGNLTEHLLQRAAGAPFVAVERDRRMPALLAERFGTLAIVEGDAVQVDYAALIADNDLGPDPVVVGNLPYNAGVPIIFSVLAARPKRIVVMLQKEVALRLAAASGSKTYGQVSVKMQLLADIRVAFKVGRGAFSPPPKVQSAVIVLTPLPSLRHEVPSQKRLWRLLEAGFGQRRKTLARALSNTIKVPKEAVQEALVALGQPATARAERLDLATWAALATELDPLLGHLPTH